MYFPRNNVISFFMGTYLKTFFSWLISLQISYIYFNSCISKYRVKLLPRKILICYLSHDVQIINNFSWFQFCYSCSGIFSISCIYTILSPIKLGSDETCLMTQFVLQSQPFIAYPWPLDFVNVTVETMNFACFFFWTLNLRNDLKYLYRKQQLNAFTESNTFTITDKVRIFLCSFPMLHTFRRDKEGNFLDFNKYCNIHYKSVSCFIRKKSVVHCRIIYNMN